jgi:hypothetical protein
MWRGSSYGTSFRGLSIAKRFLEPKAPQEPATVSFRARLTFCFFKINFNIILPYKSTLRYPKWSTSFRLLDQNPVCVCHLSHGCYMRCTSHPSRFDCAANIWCTSGFCTQTPSICILPSRRETNFHAENTDKIISLYLRLLNVGLFFLFKENLVIWCVAAKTTSLCAHLLQLGDE